MTTETLSRIAPADVHAVLAPTHPRRRLRPRHGLRAEPRLLVLQTPAAAGSTSTSCTFFGSNPLGYNHPKMKDPEFQKTLLRVALVKPALSDVYSVEYAQFVETFGRIAMPALPEPRVLRRGRGARDRERAQDGLRLEGAAQPGEGDPG